MLITIVSLQDVAMFLDEFKAVEIMSGIIEKSKAPRVIVG